MPKIGVIGCAGLGIHLLHLLLTCDMRELSDIRVIKWSLLEPGMEVVMEVKGSMTPLTKLQRIMVVMVGFAFFGAAFYVYTDIYNFGKGVHTTQGTITSLLMEKSRSPGTRSATSTLYRPVVEFTVKEKKYKFLSSTASGSYEIGQRIRVNYDPKNPSDFPNLAGPKELIYPALAGLCGAIAVLIGVLAPSKKNGHLKN